MMLVPLWYGQLRAHLSPVVLDQLPVLADMQRYLEHLSMMEPPPAKKDLVLEQVMLRAAWVRQWSLNTANGDRWCALFSPRQLLVAPNSDCWSGLFPPLPLLVAPKSDCWSALFSPRPLLVAPNSDCWSALFSPWPLLVAPNSSCWSALLSVWPYRWSAFFLPRSLLAPSWPSFPLQI